MSRKRRPEPKITVAKKIPPRWRRDQNIARLIWIIIPLIIVVSLSLVGFWAYNSYVSVWHQPIAKVNEKVIDMDYYVKMLRYYSMIWGPTVDEFTLPSQVLQIVEENEIIRQEAARLGISIPEEEVTATIAVAFPAEGQETIEIVDVIPRPQGNSTTSDGAGNESSGNSGNITTIDIIEPSPTATGTGNLTGAEMEIGELYYQTLEQFRLSDTEYRQILETSLLVPELVEYFEEENVPETAEHVYLHFIPLDTEEQAAEVSDRLKNGEDFAALAAEFAVVDEVREAGGNMGWVPRGIFTELDEVAFGLEIGNVSDPISTSGGYYIVKVTDFEESREVEDAYKSEMSKRDFESWMQEQLETSVVEYIDQGKIDWALDHMR